MTRQAFNADDGEFVFISTISPRIFNKDGVDHAGVRSIVETSPRLGTPEAHPGIVPAEVEE